MKRTVLTSFTILCLLSTVFLIGLAFDVQPVRSSGTVYIRADGSIEGTTDISTVDNVTYTFTDNIYDEIVIERDNIVVDGTGYTVQGTGSGDGIDLWNRNNVTLKNVEVTNFQYGIYLWESDNNTFTGNTASNNKHGIYLGSSNNNILAGNTASSNNEHGIQLDYSSNNTLSDNTASNNGYGIHLFRSSNNVLTGNTASHNNDGIYLSSGSNNNTVAGNTFSNNTSGVSLRGPSNNTVSENNITNNSYGVFLGFHSGDNLISGNNITNNAFGIINQVGYFVSNNLISENTIANNSYGIRLEGKNNTISGNHITNNDHGIRLVDPHSMNFTISGNDIANNGEGIVFDYAFNHFIYHNNFVNNTHHTQSGNSMNIWDDGYPSGGNYWSDYEEKYPEAEELGNSGLWDTSYIIDSDDQDHFPLVNPWPPSEHELVVSARAPASLQPGRSSSLNATVTNRGLSDESNVDLVLLINGTTVDSTSISLLQAGDSHTLSYLWTPPTEGAYNVTAYAHPVSGETSIVNNQMSKFVTVSAIAPPPEVQVGVKAGDWIKLDYTVTGWPSGTPYPEWLKVEIRSVEGTTATVRVTMHMSDGTEESDTVSVDVVAGGETFDTLYGFVIPANRTTGDSINMGGDGLTLTVTIDGETTRTYAGASRTVVYASFSQYGTELTYYWDKETGVMVEASTTSGGVAGTAKATETNMWAVTPPFWMQWWFYAIIAVVIVASAGAVYFLKKRKPPTTPSAPLENTDETKAMMNK